MCPKGEKKKCCRSLPLDVFSDLPENLIDAILMCLPFKDTVRTSVLSKKWRYNWCRLPELTLDETGWTTNKDIIFCTSKITKIISHIVRLHAGPITKFILCVPRSWPKIHDLINFLSQNGIQHLVLRRLSSVHQYKLPSSVFTCLQLRHLALESCFIHPPTVFKGFDCLTVLELNHVESSDEFFRNLISNCLLLEPLVLEQPYCLNLVEIESPTLRSFVYAGLVHEVHLKKVPLLAKVSVTFSCSPTGVHALAKFFESIPALEHFRWCSMFRFFNNKAVEVPRRLSFALNCLKHLHINLVYLDELPKLQGALCLIRSSPYSQDIEIQVYQRFQPDEYPKLLDPVTRDYVDEIPASFSDVTLNHLKAVKLEGIAGTRLEMQLIQLLLAKSPALARMKIDPYYGLEDKKSLKVVAEITNFQRASSKAEVVYNVD